MNDNKRIGVWGERYAEDFLKKQGYVLVEKNWRTNFGEIDLIVKSSGGELVFVEVKTRSGKGFGFPEEAVTRKKQETLINLANEYVREKQIKDDWRIDVISILRTNIRNIEIEWFQNAISEKE